jgi:hypothetical protein
VRVEARCPNAGKEASGRSDRSVDAGSRRNRCGLPSRPPGCDLEPPIRVSADQGRNQSPHSPRLFVDRQELSVDEFSLAVDGKEFSLDGFPLFVDGKEFFLDGFRLSLDGKRFSLDEFRLSVDEKEFSLDEFRLSLDGKEFSLDEFRLHVDGKELSVDGFAVSFKGQPAPRRAANRSCGRTACCGGWHGPEIRVPS